VQLKQLLYKSLLFLKTSQVPHLSVIDECGDYLIEGRMIDDGSNCDLTTQILTPNGVRHSRAGSDRSDGSAHIPRRRGQVATNLSARS